MSIVIIGKCLYDRISRREFLFMKRYLYVLTVVILIVLAQKTYEIVGSEWKAEESKSDALTVVSQVFQQEQIDALNCEIEAFYFYGVCYLDENDKAQILDRLAKDLGIDSVYEYKEQRTERGAEAVLTKTGANSNVSIKLITYEIPESDNVVSLRQYISVDMSIQNSITSGLFYKNQLEQALKKITQDVTDGEVYENDNIISISIQGDMEGQITIENQEKIAKKILEELEAETVFQYKPTEAEKDSAYSIYGYTKEMDEHLVIGNDKINVNVVYSYNEEENVTTMHVASPIANYDY